MLCLYNNVFIYDLYYLYSMSITYRNVDEIYKEIKDIFYNGARKNPNIIEEYINIIYKEFGKYPPQIIFYNNPNQINTKDTTFSSRLLYDETSLSEKMQKSWAEKLAKLPLEGLKEFRDNRVNLTKPEEEFKIINRHYGSIIKIPIQQNNAYSHHFFSFYQMVREFCEGEFMNTMVDFLNAGVMWYEFHEDVAHVLMTPLEIRTDLENNLHSDNPLRPAVKWAEGDPQCFLWGIPFDVELWDKVVNKRITPKECMRLPNIEQRSKALRVVGYEGLVKPEYLIDTEYKDALVYRENEDNFEKVTTRYDLYSVPGIYDDVPNIREKINVKVIHYTCPSTGREYFTTVPPDIRRPIDGMAFKFNTTREKYMKMVFET